MERTERVAAARRGYDRNQRLGVRLGLTNQVRRRNELGCGCVIR